MICIEKYVEKTCLEHFPFLYNQDKFKRFSLLLLESLGNKPSLQNDLGPSQGDFVQVDLCNLCYNPPSKQC